MDVNIAAGGTVFATIKYILLQFIINTDIQEKARKEVDEVLGTDLKPKIEDRKR